MDSTIITLSQGVIIEAASDQDTIFRVDANFTIIGGTPTWSEYSVIADEPGDKIGPTLDSLFALISGNITVSNLHLKSVRDIFNHNELGNSNVIITNCNIITQAGLVFGSRGAALSNNSIIIKNSTIVSGLIAEGNRKEIMLLESGGPNGINLSIYDTDIFSYGGTDIGVTSEGIITTKANGYSNSVNITIKNVIVYYEGNTTIDPRVIYDVSTTGSINTQIVGRLTFIGNVRSPSTAGSTINNISENYGEVAGLIPPPTSRWII